MKLVFLIISIILFAFAALGVSAFPHVFEWGMVAFACSFLPVSFPSTTTSNPS